MASVKKIVKSFLKRPQPAYYKYQDVIKVVEYFGYTKVSQNGSHFNYLRKESIMTIAHHKYKVKKPCVREIVETLNLEEWYENQ